MSVHEFRPNGGYDGGREQPPEPPQMPPTDYVTQGELRAATAELRAEMAGLRSEMHEGFSGMVKWIVGSAIAIGATGITVMTFVIGNIAAKPQPAPAAQPPIIINIPAPAPSK